MLIDKLLKLAAKFELLAVAEKEQLPENSDDIKIILKNIQELETYKARTDYAEKNLKHLSSGSSRIVYVTQDKDVVKLAKNDKGIAQNKAECKNLKQKSKYLNDILDHAKNFSWIKTKYLDKLTEKKFEELTNFNFKDFGKCVKYEISSSKKAKPKCYDKIKNEDFFKELTSFGKKFKLASGDLAKISSYGTDGKNPILLDAGLTRDVFEEYYES